MQVSDCHLDADLKEIRDAGGSEIRTSSACPNDRAHADRLRETFGRVVREVERDATFWDEPGSGFRCKTCPSDAESTC